MYCPNCGKEYSNRGLRFCSKCGFPLGFVSRLVENGGKLPELANLSSNNSIFTRKNGIVFGILWFIFFVPFLTGILGGLLELESLAAFSALLGVFGGISIIIVAAFFLPSGKNASVDFDFSKEKPANELNTKETSENRALPEREHFAPDDVAGMSGLWKAPDTGELAQTEVISEKPTRLLHREEETK